MSSSSGLLSWRNSTWAADRGQFAGSENQIGPLGGSTPLELIGTDRSARAVENVLGRVAYAGVS